MDSLCIIQYIQWIYTYIIHVNYTSASLSGTGSDSKFLTRAIIMDVLMRAIVKFLMSAIIIVTISTTRTTDT